MSTQFVSAFFFYFSFKFYSLQKKQSMLIPQIGTINHDRRLSWVINQLSKIPKGARLLDAGAGTQQFRKYANHLNYVAQDFASYIPSDKGRGLQNEK